MFNCNIWPVRLFGGALLALSAVALRADALVEHFTVHSVSMGRDIKVCAVLPPAYEISSEQHFPVLYALHGRGAPYDTFAKMPTLREALMSQPMIVVSFDADNASFYLDSPLPQNIARQGQEDVAESRFSTFFFDEFIPAIDSRYRVAFERRMLTGFSMGGFGAFHFMLQHPDMFCSVSAMSGAFFENARPSPIWADRLKPLLGDYANSSSAYEQLAFFPRLQHMVDTDVKLPPIGLFFGTEDQVVPNDTRDMHAFLDRIGVPNTYHESPGGHDWSYWSSIITQVLDFHWQSLQATAHEPALGFPRKDWMPPPADVAVIPPEVVKRAVAAIDGFTGKDGASGVMIIHRGYLLWAGDRVDEKRPVWSCTKSFLSTCLGLLWDDGKCTPDDLVSKYLPELAKEYPEVTLRHLATFTSGLHVENYSLDVQAPDYPVGTAMHYSGQSDILAYILTKIAGESLSDLFKRRIADPIGMDPASWEWKTVHTRDGMVINGGAGFPNNGMHTTACNLARFGWLYANGGVWNGQRLISRRYIDYATVPCVPAEMALFDPKGWYYELPGVYGLNWWTNGVRHDGTRLWPHAPASAFAAQGNKDNICIIVPAWQLVLVRTGQDKVIPTSNYDQALSILGEALSAR